MQWGRLIDYYLKHTPKSDQQLILVLVDILHGLKATDGMLLSMLKKYQKRFMVVFTKTDRATPQTVQQSLEVVHKMQ